MVLRNNISARPVTVLEQVTMLHCDMVKHISCNPLGANGAGRGVGLIGVVLLEVDAEGGDVVVLVAVGAGDVRPRRVPELQRHLHLHVPVVLHLHLHLLHPHPRHICTQSDKEPANQHHDRSRGARRREEEEQERQDMPSSPSMRPSCAA